MPCRRGLEATYRGRKEFPAPGSSSLGVERSDSWHWCPPSRWAVPCRTQRPRALRAACQGLMEGISVVWIPGAANTAPCTSGLSKASLHHLTAPV